jgi:putative transposase
VSRPNRVFFRGAVYHVYNRLARGERVFDDEFDAHVFAKLLLEVTVRDQLTVFAWALLGNHFHLAVRVGEVSLDRPMRSLQQRVTRSVNARRRVFGPLWQGRYKAKLVQEQRYLDQLLFYIHLNPVKAGIVDDPAEYPWSGHRELLGRVKDPIVEVDTVLRLFGKSRRSARAAYTRQLNAAAEENWANKSPGYLPWWRLGRPPKGEDEDPETAYRRKLEQESQGPADRPSLDVEDFVKIGASIIGISLEDLRGRQKQPEIVSARETLAVLGVERYSLRVVDIATAMSKSPDTMTKAIARATKRRLNGDDRLRALDELDSAIAKEGLAANNGGTA